MVWERDPDFCAEPVFRKPPTKQSDPPTNLWHSCYTSVSLWALWSVFSVCLFLYQPHNFYYSDCENVLVFNGKNPLYFNPSILILSRFLWTFVPSYAFQSDFIKVLKKPNWIFHWDCVEFTDYLRERWHLYIMWSYLRWNVSFIQITFWYRSPLSFG